jgi:hypothetical protein
MVGERCPGGKLGGRWAAERPSLIKVKGKPGADVGESLKGDVYELCDAAGAQQVDCVEEGDDDEVGKVKAAEERLLRARALATAAAAAALGGTQLGRRGGDERGVTRASIFGGGTSCLCVMRR